MSNILVDTYTCITLFILIRRDFVFYFDLIVRVINLRASYKVNNIEYKCNASNCLELLKNLIVIQRHIYIYIYKAIDIYNADVVH